MAKDRSNPLDKISFYCKPCFHSFKAAPSRIEDAPDQPHHPYQYFGTCPNCEREVEQVHWEKNLIAAWGKSTGPKTEEGKAATAANLEGHPTKEESLRTRFNAMKHGMNARTANYFPAKPDGYSFCQGCDVDRVFCRQQAACTKKTELFMLHHAAFEQRNPKHLMGIYSDMHAGVFALVQQIVQVIVADGVKIESVVWDYDKDNNVRVAEYVDEEGNRKLLRKELTAHPLLKSLGELLTRSGLTLSDMGMTNKVIEAEDDSFGNTQDAPVKVDANEYRQRQVLALQDMADKIQRANKQTDQDPILLEYNQENS
ncbi:hypothetical protein LG200_05030 [Methylobacillus caricis]|uniref:hypothetical protein n=1 Tax=Methylobacillus caricis TaxID=1971611 RepID=UPI001CFFEA57|nr:hypothetical protein [Methylobacillus caricis]MCB5187367.1 hypothetical protein [Methylobacillus caricis]